MRTIDADELRLRIVDDMQQYYVQDPAAIGTSTVKMSQIEAVNRVLDLLGTAPTVDRVVHAHWMDIWNLWPFEAYSAMCSACRTRNDIPPLALARYCPSCGARMDEEPELI